MLSHEVEVNDLRSSLDRLTQVVFQSVTVYLENASILMADLNGTIVKYLPNTIGAGPSGFQFPGKQTKARIIKQNTIAHLELFVVLQPGVVELFGSLLVDS